MRICAKKRPLSNRTGPLCADSLVAAAKTQELPLPVRWPFRSTSEAFPEMVHRKPSKPLRSFSGHKNCLTSHGKNPSECLQGVNFNRTLLGYALMICDKEQVNTDNAR